MTLLKNILKINLLAFALIFFIACDEENPTPENDPNTSLNLTPNISGSDGSFWAIKTITETTTIAGPFQTILGTAVAVGTTDNYLSFEDLGTVTCNTKTLTKNDNNSYVYIPSLIDVTGIEFTNDVDWEISGSNNFSAFTQSASDVPFPEVGTITSSETVNKADGYLVESDFVSDADSVYFLVGTALKKAAGGTKTMEFTAADLADVPSGTLVVQVAAFSIRNKELQGKSFWFGNETVQSKLVTVQ